MDGERRSAEEALERELQDLRPTILHQQHAETRQPDPAFVRALRSRLVGSPETETLPARIRRVVATLLAPPTPSAALAGLRGAPGTPQSSTYTAEDLHISLGAEQEGSQVTVRGIVYGERSDTPEITGARVQLLHGEVRQDQGILDEFGAFTLHAPAGTYTLRLHLSEREIDVVDLTLGA
jgi:hypothetical protein